MQLDFIEFISLFQGFVLSSSLFMHVSTINSFVLQQAIYNNNKFITASFTSLLYIIAFSLGILFISLILILEENFISTFKILGIFIGIFIIVHNITNFFKDEILYISNKNFEITPKDNLLIVFAIVILNRNLYLECFLFVGLLSIGVELDKIQFFYGLILGTLAWFYGLTYFANILRGLLAINITWKISRIWGVIIISTILLNIIYKNF